MARSAARKKAITKHVDTQLRVKMSNVSGVHMVLNHAKKAKVKNRRMGKEKAFSRVLDLLSAKKRAFGLYKPAKAQMALAAARSPKSQTSQVWPWSN